VANLVVDAIVLRYTPSQVLSCEKYSIVEGSWKFILKASDYQQALTVAPIGTPSVYHLPSGVSINSDPRSVAAVSIEFCLMLSLSDV
jgi:hypothetical protein